MSWLSDWTGVDIHFDQPLPQIVNEIHDQLPTIAKDLTNPLGTLLLPAIKAANDIVDSVTGINLIKDVQEAEDGIQAFIDDHKQDIIAVGQDILAAGLTAAGVPAPLAFAISDLAADLIKNDGKIDPETVGAVLGSAIGGPVA